MAVRELVVARASLDAGVATGKDARVNVRLNLCARRSGHVDVVSDAILSFNEHAWSALKDLPGAARVNLFALRYVPRSYALPMV